MVGTQHSRDKWSWAEPCLCPHYLEVTYLFGGQNLSTSKKAQGFMGGPSFSPGCEPMRPCQEDWE